MLVNEEMDNPSDLAALGHRPRSLRDLGRWIAEGETEGLLNISRL